MTPAISNLHQDPHLPLHPYDCTIELLPWTAPPKVHANSLCTLERKAMDEYIKDALSIHPSSSPASARCVDFLCGEGQDCLAQEWLLWSELHHGEELLPSATHLICYLASSRGPYLHQAWLQQCLPFHPDLGRIWAKDGIQRCHSDWPMHLPSFNPFTTASFVICFMSLCTWMAFLLFLSPKRNTWVTSAKCFSDCFSISYKAEQCVFHQPTVSFLGLSFPWARSR